MYVYYFSLQYMKNVFLSILRRLFMRLRAKKNIAGSSNRNVFVLFFAALNINKIVMEWELYVWNVNELPAGSRHF